MNVRQFEGDTITMAIARIDVRTNFHGVLCEKPYGTAGRLDVNNDFVFATPPVAVEFDTDLIACLISVGVHSGRYSWKLREDRRTIGLRALGYAVYKDFQNSIVRIKIHG